MDICLGEEGRLPCSGKCTLVGVISHPLVTAGQHLPRCPWCAQFAVCGRAALCISLPLPPAPALALAVPSYRQGGQVLSASCCTRFVRLSSIFHRIKRKPANDQGRALGGSQLSAGGAAAGSGGPGLPSAPPATPRGFLLAPSRPPRRTPPAPGPSARSGARRAPSPGPAAGSEPAGGGSAGCALTPSGTGTGTGSSPAGGSGSEQPSEGLRRGAEG